MFNLLIKVIVLSWDLQGAAWTGIRGRDGRTALQWTESNQLPQVVSDPRCCISGGWAGWSEHNRQRNTTTISSVGIYNHKATSRSAFVSIFKTRIHNPRVNSPARFSERLSTAAPSSVWSTLASGQCEFKAGTTAAKQRSTRGYRARRGGAVRQTSRHNLQKHQMSRGETAC